jgi:hypothetical protein
MNEAVPEKAESTAEPKVEKKKEQRSYLRLQINLALAVNVFRT